MALEAVSSGESTLEVAVLLELSGQMAQLRLRHRDQNGLMTAEGLQSSVSVPQSQP